MLIRSIDNGRRRARMTVVASTLVAAISVLLTACGSPEVEESAGPRIEGVTVERVEMSTVPALYEATGVVRSKIRSSLSSKVMGDVRSILVREGERVRKGQTLLTIDARDVEANLKQAEAGSSEVGAAIRAAEAGVVAAEANQKLAAATWERFRVLQERRSVSPQEFEEVEARHAAANAELERARQSLAQLRAKKAQAEAAVAQARAAYSWSQITSPVDGIVVAKFVDVGDQASPGRTLLEVEAEGAHQIEANVEESRIGRIHVDDTVEIRVESVDLVFDGRVSEVVPSMDSSIRAFVVRIDIPEATASPNLRSGMFARVAFALDQRQAILVPRDAVVTRGQLTGIWTVGEGGVARFRLVKTGHEAGARIEVLSGLEAGESIISSGLDKLTDGAQVVSGDGETSRP